MRGRTVVIGNQLTELQVIPKEVIIYRLNKVICE